MHKFKKHRCNGIIISVFLFLIVSCNNSSKTAYNKESKTYFLPLKYSKQFCIAKQDSQYLLFNTLGKDTQKVSLLNNQQLPRVAVLSTVFAGFIEVLGMQKCIVGLDNESFYNDSIILKKIQDKSIKEIGEEGQLRTEEIIALKPDYLIVSSFNNSQKEAYTLLNQFGVKIIYCDNFKEQHPLARAEWLKFFGVLFNCYPQADSIFNIIETNYNNLKNNAVNQLKPKVLADAPFGDTWFVPGGNSFTARLIEDAGGEYVFKDKVPLFSYPLHLEDVLSKAQQADVWIHLNQYKSMAEIANADKRYTLFKPFQNKTMFNNNKQENSKGGNAFWEIGAARPDWILSDLRAIISRNYTNEKNWYFYQPLN